MTRRADTLWQLLSGRAQEIITADGLRRKLTRRRKLRVKLGIDPTSPHLHIGFAVPLRILRAFQDAGHQAVLIIGDFTAQVGDPAEREIARRQLSAEEVRRNQRGYLRQIGQIVDLEKAEVRHNSEWFSRMRLPDFLGLLRHVPLRSAWEREDFQKRLAAGKEVRLHEAMYSVLQGYDSVATRADIEIGAVEQRLNLLAGRELQRALRQPPQDIVLFPYLIGLDGKKKMSKSIGNTVNLRDSASDIFGKVMSMPDALIVHYAELAAWLPARAVHGLQKRLGRRENPRDVKLDVAEAVARLYHGVEAAKRARAEFIRVFSRRELPREFQTLSIRPGSHHPLDLLVAIKAAVSKSQARRLIAGGAVTIDGLPLTPRERTAALRRGSIIRVGKKQFFKVG